MELSTYWKEGRKKITAVTAMADYTLVITFGENEKRLLDMKPVLKNGGVFSDIQPLERFQNVYIDDCNCIAWDRNPEIDSEVVWNNKLDLCPDACYLDSVPLDTE